MSYVQLKECYFSPYSLNDTSCQVLKTLQEHNVGGIDVKGQQGLDFFDYYDRLVASFPSNFNMLQINVKKGYSIVTWLRRFPNCTITAIEKSTEDWDSVQSVFDLTPEEKVRLKVLAIDPDSPSLLSSLQNQTFDIILDHGHRPSQQRQVIFESLFPSLLAPLGLYIWEDVFCQGDDSMRLLYSAQELIPYTYKFKNWGECSTLMGRSAIRDQVKKNWKFSIQYISFHRDIIVFTKEDEVYLR